MDKISRSNCPEAPLRFCVLTDDCWLGKPSLAYGVVRRLAYEERATAGYRYARVHFGQGGRRGDPWGAMSIEVNGKLRHFYANLGARIELHDGHGSLTNEGNRLIATGVPGHISKSLDWRWIQDEANLQISFDSEAAERWYADRLAGRVPMPMFQSRMGAVRLGIPISEGSHNCTTSVAEAISMGGVLGVSGWYPLSVFGALKYRSHRTPLDDKLNVLLWQEEELIEEACAHLAPRFDWNAYAKGVLPSAPAAFEDIYISCAARHIL